MNEKDKVLMTKVDAIHRGIEYSHPHTTNATEKQKRKHITFYICISFRFWRFFICFCINRAGYTVRFIYPKFA